MSRLNYCECSQINNTFVCCEYLTVNELSETDSTHNILENMSSTEYPQHHNRETVPLSSPK